MLKNLLKYHKLPLFMLLALLCLYASFAYDLVRSDFVKLLSLYAALCFLTYKVIQLLKHQFWVLVGFGVLSRLIFLFALPNLSQDYFRFLWDGRLLAEGVNPYISFPQQFISAENFTIVPQALQLVEGMGSLSAGNFTNYPPVSQLIYWFSGIVAPKSILGGVVLIRVVLILADVVSLFFIRKILLRLELPQHRVLWYFLNPLVIIELTGNLHFEGLMVCFLAVAFWLLILKKYTWAAVLFGLSVSVKLLPLVLLPLFFNYFRKNKELGLKKLLLFYGITGTTILVTFLPFLSTEFLQHFSSSVGLWFSKFEFNASIYYVIRWIGFQTIGWNIIGTVGKILPVLVLLMVLGLSLFRKNNSEEKLFTAMLFALSLYLLFATTVHPWYLITVLFLAVFTKYNYMWVWSFTVILSYLAYTEQGFQENLWVVAAEYLIVIGYFIFELKNKKPYLAMKAE